MCAITWLHSHELSAIYLIFDIARFPTSTSIIKIMGTHIYLLLCLLFDRKISEQENPPICKNAKSYQSEVAVRADNW